MLTDGSDLTRADNAFQALTRIVDGDKRYRVNSFNSPFLIGEGRGTVPLMLSHNT